MHVSITYMVYKKLYSSIFFVKKNIDLMKENVS